MPKPLLFIINTGSTSTKLALFEGERQIRSAEPDVPTQWLEAGLQEQMPLRLEQVKRQLADWSVEASQLTMIVARGGALYNVKSGAYRIAQLMSDVLLYGSKVGHAGDLSVPIAFEIAGDETEAITYDAPYADEVDPIAKISGLPEVTLFPGSHVLNTKRVAQQVAEQMERPYEQCSFIVAHLGGGITVNAQKNGRIVDAVFDDMGPMSPQRAGRIPARNLVPLCYGGQYTQQEMMRRLYHQSGIQAYFGTQDMRVVERRIDNGDGDAALIYEAMAYQTAKAIGELATVLRGQVDAIVLTGGIAHSQRFTGWISERVSFISKVVNMPGEYEMQALAEGGLRVLSGMEEAKAYEGLPPDCATVDQFYKKYVHSPKK